MDANEHFEMIANEFYLDTGYLRPGKSESPVTYYEGRDREREVAFEVWCKMRKQNAALKEEVGRLREAVEWANGVYGTIYYFDGPIERHNEFIAELRRRAGGKGE